MRRLRCSAVLLLSLLATAVPAHAVEPIDQPCIVTSAGFAPGPEDPERLVTECPYGRT